jgi:hypothetical protein
MSAMTLEPEITAQSEGVAADKKVTYCTVKFSVGWLPGAIGFTEAAKAALAAQMKLDKRIVRGSYAILGASRDPLIQQGASLKRLLMQVRSEYTIPEYTLVSTANRDEENKAEKVAGSYLIEACKVEEFLQKFNVVRQQYLTWGKQVTEDENYTRLREADKKALGSDWEVVATKYPTQAQLADAITCDVPRIEPFDASFTLSDVAPATAKLLRDQAQSRLQASVDGAVGELVFEFKELVESVARNCGKRVRLSPPLDHVKTHLRNAEVQSILRHTDDESIPEDSLLVTLQPAFSAGNNKFVQSGSAEQLLLTTAEYNSLCPYETNENRILSQSSFDNVIWLSQKIQSVQTMLGDDNGAKELTALAEEVQQTLTNVGKSSAEITRQLKNSSYARNSIKATFQAFATKLTTQEMEIRQTKSQARRRIQIGGDAA